MLINSCTALQAAIVVAVSRDCSERAALDSLAKAQWRAAMRSLRGTAPSLGFWVRAFRVSAYPRRFDIPISPGGMMGECVADARHTQCEPWHDMPTARTFGQFLSQPPQLGGLRPTFNPLGFSHRRPLNSTRPLGISFAVVAYHMQWCDERPPACGVGFRGGLDPPSVSADRLAVSGLGEARIPPVCRPTGLRPRV